MIKKILTLVLLLISTIIYGTDINKIAEDYPYKNSGITATVLGTPKNQWYEFKKGKAPKVRTVKTTKKIPEILREWNQYDYGVWTQENEAPLMILVSGTGSLYNSGLSLYLANVFYDRGYNVIAFSSPTTMPYIVSQSENNYAGYIKDETSQLYKLIVDAVNKEKQNKMKISEVYVGGYSLGGFQSLLIHEIDSKEQKLKINKSLLLNTPISILTATQKLDSYLVKNGIYDAKGLEKYLDDKFSKILYDEKLDLNNMDLDNLVSALSKLGVTEKDFEILTGLLFRFYSANMTFAGEVFSGKNATGRLTEKKEYKRFDSITKEFHEGLSVSFSEYSLEILYPSLKNKYPNLTLEQFINNFDLKNSQEFIDKYNDKIVFITSKDDVLLSNEDLNYIDNTFNNKVVIPFGGHTGLLWHKDVAKLMVDKLEGK